MIGSRLLGQQPTFRGADFAIPEVALFGYYQFRSAVATSDSWEQHDGIEILFMRSGEACWDLEDENLAVVNGGQALLFPAGMRHRIANGLYTPCRLFWMVFHAKDLACANTALFRKGEIEALFEIAARQDAPIDLPEACGRNLSDLCSRLTDERLMIGSASIMAEVRSKIYSSVIELWETCANGHDSPAHSQLVRRAAALLRESADGHDCDERDERIGEVARQLGYGKSRLYSLFSREVGMAPNDYRQRVRVKRCCERLARTDESITSIAISAGFGSSQYFSRVFRKYVGVTPTAYRGLFGSRSIS